MKSVDNNRKKPRQPKTFAFGEYIGVAISLIALTISLVSLWDSHKNSVLQNELARPLLEVEGATATAKIDGDYRVLNLSASVKNIGHLTAFVTKQIAQPDVAVTREGEPLLTCFKDLDSEQSSRPNLSSEIPENGTSHFFVMLELPRSCPVLDRRVLIFNVTLEYHDRINHSYTQQVNGVLAAVTQPTE